MSPPPISHGTFSIPAHLRRTLRSSARPSSTYAMSLRPDHGPETKKVGTCPLGSSPRLRNQNYSMAFDRFRPAFDPSRPQGRPEQRRGATYLRPGGRGDCSRANPRLRVGEIAGRKLDGSHSVRKTEASMSGACDDRRPFRTSSWSRMAVHHDPARSPTRARCRPSPAASADPSRGIAGPS